MSGAGQEETDVLQQNVGVPLSPARKTDVVFYPSCQRNVPIAMGSLVQSADIPASSFTH
jgi:hypothetical protein